MIAAMSDELEATYQYCPFCPLELSAREIAEGYVRYCETSHLSKRQKILQRIVDDENYMHAIMHAVSWGPLQTGLEACEIIAKEHPESCAYEQLLIGQFSDFLNNLAKCETEEIEKLSEKIVQSQPLNELAFEIFTGYLETDAETLLNRLRKKIAKKRKWKHRLQLID